MSKNVIGENIKARRESRGTSQEALAGLMGIGVSTLIRIENGKQDPTLPTLRKVADFFECELVDLLRPYKEEESRRPLSDYAMLRMIFREELAEVFPSIYLVDVPLKDRPRLPRALIDDVLQGARRQKGAPLTQDERLKVLELLAERFARGERDHA